MAARGFLGGGDLYIARYSPTLGTFEELAGPFEASQFSIQPNIELKEMSSRGRSTYGQVIESVPLAQPAELSITLTEVNKDSLIMALFGTSEVVNQGSGSVTDEVVAVTAAKMDKWLMLSKQNLASVDFAVTSTDGLTTYTLGTDYEVNYRMGWLKILDSGAIPTTGNIHVDFDYGAITGTNILGATESQVRAKLVLDGINFADQLPVVTTVWEAVLSPDSAIDMLGDDFAQIQLTGRLKTPTGKTAPFEVQLRDAA